MIPELVRMLLEDRRMQTAAAFHVAVLCESAHTRVNAENFSRGLAAFAHLPLQLGFWDFQLLGVREVRNAAAGAAAEAHVVVFAISGKKPLPTKVEAWIEMWIWLISHGHPAVVALFETDGREVAAISTYLRQKAGCKGLGFFSQVNPYPVPSSQGEKPGYEEAADQNFVPNSSVAFFPRAPTNDPV